MTRTCPICGKELPENANSRKKYCSDECARKAKNLARRSRRAAKQGKEAEVEEPKQVQKEEPKAAPKAEPKATKTKGNLVELKEGEVRCGRCKLGYIPNDPEFVVGWRTGDDGAPKVIKLCPRCNRSFHSFLELGRAVGDLVALES